MSHLATFVAGSGFELTRTLIMICASQTASAGLAGMDAGASRDSMAGLRWLDPFQLLGLLGGCLHSSAAASIPREISMAFSRLSVTFALTPVRCRSACRTLVHRRI